MTQKKRGFALLTPEQRRQIASNGGKASQQSGRGHRYTSETASVAGRKGGNVVSQNTRHMSQIGRKGGMTTKTKRRGDGK